LRGEAPRSRHAESAERYDDGLRPVQSEPREGPGFRPADSSERRVAPGFLQASDALPRADVLSCGLLPHPRVAPPGLRQASLLPREPKADARPPEYAPVSRPLRHPLPIDAEREARDAAP